MLRLFNMCNYVLANDFLNALFIKHLRKVLELVECKFFALVASFTLASSSVAVFKLHKTNSF